MAHTERRSEADAESWEPMETAPLDGTPIRVRRGELVASVSWSNTVGAWESLTFPIEYFHGSRRHGHPL